MRKFHFIIFGCFEVIEESSQGIERIKRSVIFLPGGGLWKFLMFRKYLVMSKIFLIPPEVLQNLCDPPPTS